jgi:hypothetical protein
MLKGNPNWKKIKEERKKDPKWSAGLGYSSKTINESLMDVNYEAFKKIKNGTANEKDIETYKRTMNSLMDF